MWIPSQAGLGFQEYTGLLTSTNTGISGEELECFNQEGNWGPINWFSPDTFLCLSQARTLIAIATSYVVGFFLCSVNEDERGLFALLMLVELLTITV
jgi:hypothetical protein